MEPSSMDGEAAKATSNIARRRVSNQGRNQREEQAATPRPSCDHGGCQPNHPGYPQADIRTDTEKRRQAPTELGEARRVLRAARAHLRRWNGLVRRRASAALRSGWTELLHWPQGMVWRRRPSTSAAGDRGRTRRSTHGFQSSAGSSGRTGSAGRRFITFETSCHFHSASVEARRSGDFRITDGITGQPTDAITPG